MPCTVTGCELTHFSLSKIREVFRNPSVPAGVTRDQRLVDFSWVGPATGIELERGLDLTRSEKYFFFDCRQTSFEGTCPLTRVQVGGNNVLNQIGMVRRGRLIVLTANADLSPDPSDFFLDRSGFDWGNSQVHFVRLSSLLNAYSTLRPLEFTAACKQALQDGWNAV